MNRRIYCDSSVLLKRYREEPDSETCSRELERMTLGGDFLLSSKLALVEVIPGRHLGTLDAIHVATALIMRADLVVTRDQRMIEACTEVGLAVA